MFRVEPYKKLITCRIVSIHRKNPIEKVPKLVELIKRECLKTLAKHQYAVKAEAAGPLWEYCLSQATERLRTGDYRNQFTNSEIPLTSQSQASQSANSAQLAP